MVSSDREFLFVLLKLRPIYFSSTGLDSDESQYSSDSEHNSIESVRLGDFLWDLEEEILRLGSEATPPPEESDQMKQMQLVSLMKCPWQLLL